MPARLIGVRSVSLSRDVEGHREYKVKVLVENDSIYEGPAIALTCPDLPPVGSYYALGTEFDLYATLRPTTTVNIHDEREGDANLYYTLDLTYSTKPVPRDQQRCGSVPIEDPLLEPMKVSGQGNRFTQEATVDRFGRAILSSSYEMVRGPQVEFDDSRPSIKIEFNSATLPLPLLTAMVNTVNAYPLWGLPKRCIKLSNYSWDKQYQGFCSVYYKISLEFDINYKTFDRDILDEGTKVLNGHWDATTGAWVLDNINGSAPSPTNPSHYIKAVDRSGNPTRLVLNGAGLPAEVALGGPNVRYVAVAAGTNHVPTDTAYWIPITVPPVITPWDSEVLYYEGDLVFVSSVVYVSNADENIDEVPGASASWTFIGPYDGETPASSLTDKGNWSSSTAYVTGDYVKDTRATVVGSIHVEKYGESDFLYLGIPTEF